MFQEVLVLPGKNRVGRQDRGLGISPMARGTGEFFVGGFACGQVGSHGACGASQHYGACQSEYQFLHSGPRIT